MSKKSAYQSFATSRFPRVTATELIPVYNFVVMLNEFIYGFQEVSGLEVESRKTGYNEGGVNDHQIIIGEPDNTTHTLSFSRGMILRSSELIGDAGLAGAALTSSSTMERRAAMLKANSLDPQSALENGPAVGMIYVFGRSGDIKAIFSFFSLGLSKWSISNLSAQDSGYLIESIDIYHTGLKRLPVDFIPSMGNAWINSDQDNTIADVIEKEVLLDKKKADLNKQINALENQIKDLNKKTEATQKEIDKLKAKQKL